MQSDDFLKDERLVAPRRPPPRRSRAGWIVALVLLLIAAAVGVYLFQREDAGLPTPKPIESLPEAVAEPQAATPRHPIEAVLPEGSGEEIALPSLADSDEAALAILAALLGVDQADALFVPEHLVPRIVATVDNLPERRLARRILPLRPVPGSFRVETVDGRTVVAGANQQRYAEHVRLLENADTEALVAAYARHYPLFQQAYRELGYPHAHFNDRLVQVIDHLLEAPVVSHVEELRPEKSAWAYANEALEQASAGHKLMFRLGPENATRVKAKLRELRAAVTGEHAPELPEQAEVPAAAAEPTD